MTWWLFDTVVLFITLILFIAVFSRLKKQNKLTEQKLDEIESQLFTLSEQLSNHHAQFVKQQGDIQTSIHRIDELDNKIARVEVIAVSVNELSQQTAELTNQVQLVQSESKQQQMYGRAKKMIEMGADIEELMSECEVPRAEAELLFSMYKK